LAADGVPDLGRAVGLANDGVLAVGRHGDAGDVGELVVGRAAVLLAEHGVHGQVAARG